MEFSVMILAGAFATVMILSALRYDHIETMKNKERRIRGTDKDAA